MDADAGSPARLRQRLSSARRDVGGPARHAHRPRLPVPQGVAGVTSRTVTAGPAFRVVADPGAAVTSVGRGPLWSGVHSGCMAGAEIVGEPERGQMFAE